MNLYTLHVVFASALLIFFSISESKTVSIDDFLQASSLKSKEATLAELDRWSRETSFESIKATAILCFFGNDFLLPNYEKAFQTFEKAYQLSKSDAEILFMLGIMKSYGIGCPLNPVEGLMFLYTAAATLDYQPAQSALGYTYQNGLGVEKDCKLAKMYYFKSARAVLKKLSNKDAVSVRKPTRLSLQSITSGSEKFESHREAIEYYEYGAKSDDPSSNMILAQLYYFGTEGKDPDYERARVHFEKAASGGKFAAFGFLGQIYYFGEGVEKDLDQAYAYFSKGSDKNVASAINGMGLMYWKGDVVVKDLDVAEAYFKRAAELKFPDAYYNYAMVLTEQPSTSAANFNLIFQNIISAVKAGYAFANIELTKRYLKSDKSCRAAVLALRQVVEKGPVLKLFKLAHDFYIRGLQDQALSLYMYLSAQGFEVANYNAAFILEHSDDSWRYQNRALLYYHRSALLDNSMSRKKVGDSHYLRGDVVAAVAHYVVASRAQPPSAESLFNLGYAYEHGKGFKKNFFYSLDMYRRALKFEKSAKIAVNLAITKLKIKMLFDRSTYGTLDKGSTSSTKESKEHFLMVLTLILTVIIYWYINYFQNIDRLNLNNQNQNQNLNNNQNHLQQQNNFNTNPLENAHAHNRKPSQDRSVEEIIYDADEMKEPQFQLHSVHSDSSLSLSSSTISADREDLIDFSFKIPEKKKNSIKEIEEVD